MRRWRQPEGAALSALQAYLNLCSVRGARLSVLIYHRVLEAPDPLLTGDPDAETFDWQMALLARHFRVLPLAEACTRLADGRLPARAVCVTFDDGYADNERVALPILRRHGIPAAFFISTGYLDGGRMWNDTVIEAVRRLPGETLDLSELGLGIHPTGSAGERVQAIGALLTALKHLAPAERQEHTERIGGLVSDLPADLMMTREQVRRLHSAGMEIGAHTVSHPILASVSAGEARREIAEGREQAEEIVAGRVRLFAYPNGKPGRDYGAEHVRMVQEEGFDAAVSTHWGVAGPRTDRYQLPRFTPWDRTPLRFMGRLVRNHARLQ